MIYQELYTMGLRRTGLTGENSTYVTNYAVYLDISVGNLLGIGSSEWYFLRKKGTLTTVADDNQMDLASDVAYVKYMKNYTKNWPMKKRSLEWLQDIDPDESRTGDSEYYIPLAINEATNAWEVLLYPTPTSAMTLTYWYIKNIPSFSTIADSEDLKKYFPLWAQHYVMFDAAMMYQTEQGDFDGATGDKALRDMSLQAGLNIQESFTMGTDIGKIGDGYVNMQAGNSYDGWIPADGSLS